MSYTAILTAGQNTIIKFPQQIDAIGFENWGNALSMFCEEVTYVPSDFLFKAWTMLALQADILMIELSDKRLEAFATLSCDVKRPKLIIGVEHSPLKMIDNNRGEMRDGAITAYKMCDIIIPVTNASGKYLELFTDAFIASELAMPIPMDFVSRYRKGVGYDTDTATLFHRIVPSTPEYDIYSTLKALTDMGIHTRCLVDSTNVKREDIERLLGGIGISDSVELREQLPHTDFISFLETTEFACQVAALPSSGRTAAIAAVCGRCSIASAYRYQELFFPELIVESVGDLSRRIGYMKSHYHKISEAAFKRAQGFNITAVGEKLHRLVKKHGY